MHGLSKYDTQERYDEWNTKQVKLKRKLKTDEDIFKWIDKHRYGKGTSIQGAIKALIREDIARNTQS